MRTKPPDKPLFWLHGEIKTPPFSAEARIETGVLLRRLQRGELISLPHSRPMPSIGRRCHELRVLDRDESWRIVYPNRQRRNCSRGSVQQEDQTGPSSRHREVQRASAPVRQNRRIGGYRCIS